MGNKLLLADDSITIQKVVGIIFANEECQLTVVDNGNDALTKAREIRPDIMLVDAIMPGKSGYEVCVEARQDPFLKNTPILLLTGAFEPFDEAKAKQSGADDFISKPFESQQLIDKVQSLIESGRSAVATEPAVAETVASAPPPVSPAEESWSVPEVESFAGVMVEPEPVDDAADFFVAPEVDEVAAPVEPLIAREVVEASPDDDLWGAFSMEDEQEESVQFGELVTDNNALAADDIVEAAPFAVEGFESASVFAVEEESPVVGMPEFGVPEEEQNFIFEEEEPATDSLVAFEEEDVFVAPEIEDSLPPSATVATSGPDVVEMQGLEFADEEGFGAFVESAPQIEPVAPAVAPPVAQASGSITLTEDQLAQAISRISREIIERIAWEVVPDLAEALIKDEIRKIREGT